MKNKTLIIIPTYNEKENIPQLLKEIKSKKLGVDVLIVDDNSPDGTGALADSLAKKDKSVHVMHRQGKLGLGTAYVAGFKYALKNGYNFVMEMDADFSHDPNYLRDFLREIESYDLVVGSRYINGISVVNWSLWRLLLSLGGGVYTRIITGLPMADLTGGFKCFRRSVLEAIDLDKVQSDGYAFQIEMNYKAYKKGFKIKEIPIIFVDRRVGVSKMSRGIVTEAMLTPWKLIFGR